MKIGLMRLLLAVIFFVTYSRGHGNCASSGPGADSSLTAYDNAGASALSLGLGVSGGFQGASVYFPIIVGQNFRVEPELGYFRLTEQNHLGTISVRRGLGLSKLGVGVLCVVPLSTSSRVYFGPRVARLAGAGSEGYLLTPSGGFELGSSHFTVGLELRWHYIRLECYNDESPVPSREVVTHSGFVGEAHVFLRAYL
ncbi:MAG: hypothetical protein ACP5JH_11865 [Bacteroidota bacterium]